ncbi:MAG: GxxExxY protein [Pseudomonadota bacterium]|nr:GxxExxY protein [Pseudomonadota bacterium]
MSKRLSEVVIGCAIEVHRALGHGFLERVYELALAVEFKQAGVMFERQKSLPVTYRGEIVGEYCCDFLAANQLIIEVKALSSTSSEHEAQVLNYLKATGTSVGLLLNFGAPRLGIKRLVLHHNDTSPI